MSSTLARRLRRIGLLKTERKAIVTGEKLVTGEQGKEQVVPTYRFEVVKNFDAELTEDARQQMQRQLIKKWRADRKQRRAEAHTHAKR